MIVDMTHLWHTHKATPRFADRDVACRGFNTPESTSSLFNPFMMWTRAALIGLRPVMDLY